MNEPVRTVQQALRFTGLTPEPVIHLQHREPQMPGISPAASQASDISQQDVVTASMQQDMTEQQQIDLRRALVGSVNATCADCPLGLDLAQAEFSVGVFAHTMTANCGQAAQVIYNYTGMQVNEVAGYEDLWKFTLVNYNAGGGCLADAISNAAARRQEIDWEHVSTYLTGACSGAVDYVNDISK